MDPYTIKDLEALLLVQEELFDKYKLAASSILQANIVFAPYVTGNHFNKKKFHSNSSRGARFRGSHNSQQSSRISVSRNNNGNSYNASSNSWTPDRPQCQTCDKARHTTVNCWHRYDQTNNSQFKLTFCNFLPQQIIKMTPHSVEFHQL